MSVTAPVTNISRCSLHDGPGVRTVVYLKGCALRCPWCHNPETLRPAAEIIYNGTKCIHCGRCIDRCPEHHKIENDTMVFTREGCTGCGRCAEACPGGALSLCGEPKTPAEVFEEILKDRMFYKTSGGGVTVSGGECLLHPAFVSELLTMCRQADIHTAIETALGVPWESVEAVLPLCDLVFADVKLPDEVGYKTWTGAEGKRIFENLQKLTSFGVPVCLRIPLIPGVNDGEECLEKMGERIASFGPFVQRVELLRYNPLGEGKYLSSGREFTRFGEIQSDGDMEKAKNALEKALAGKAPVFYL